MFPSGRASSGRFGLSGLLIEIPLQLEAQVEGERAARGLDEVLAGGLKFYARACQYEII